jgi:zinc protease
MAVCSDPQPIGYGWYLTPMRLAAALLRLALLFPVLLPAVDPAAVRTHTLQNGMKLIIEEDHDIPNVAMYLFYKVGSRNEHPGITGISHFFEHMMFNGAKKYGPKQFDIEMEKAGGRNNAYTTRDVTVYTDWFPSTALRLMFDMESDRIKDLSFDPSIIESERGVVASERLTRTDNSNFGLLFEQLNAAAYTAHPYGWPVVGWPSDIKSWTMADLKAHFRMGYAPNNCVMVVVGDVSTNEVLKLAKEYMEPIPRHDPPPPVRTVEPAQLGERRVSVVKRSELPIQLVSYHIPNAADKDLPALEVLSAVLSEGRSSRLYSRMVDREQIALAAQSSAEHNLDPGEFIFLLRPRAGMDTATTEKVLFEEIEKVRTTEIPAEELRKAKNQLLTNFYREMKTISGRANQLGTAEIFLGGYEKMYDTPSRYESVMAADVLRVAKQYLGPNQRTIATLIPEVTK